jgi:hypothetical protein
VIFGYDVEDICEHLLEKIGAFWWLDHQERGCELVALLLDRTDRQSGWSFFGLLGMRMRGECLREENSFE